MAKAPCSRVHDHLSAYVDGTLTPKRWEQISYHLAGCDDCRQEVAAISALCSTLSSSGGRATPESLAARLESIAGEHSSAPLYMASGSGELPSLRRKRVRRATQGGAVLLAAMVSAVVLAVLVAPSPLVITDPVKDARELYARSLTAISVNEAVGAMLLANDRGADFGASETYEPRHSETESIPISAGQAADLLRQAAEADLTLTGTQQVWASDGAGYYRTAHVGTTKVAGEGANLEVYDARGDLFSSSFLPEFGARAFTAPSEWSYQRSATSEQIVGRGAVRVQASSGSAPVARWWIDADTGLLLWAERYDGLGRVNVAFGYKQLFLDAATLDVEGAPQLIALYPASSSEEAGWCVGLEHCPQLLAGLPLVAYASSGKGDALQMNLVYSDGFTTAVVDWSDGVLAGAETSRTDRGTDMSVAVWQSGDAVISVACDCSQQLMLELKEGLPAERPYRPSIVVKIREGLSRLTGIR
ncbi:MAG: zf-HC2 domain-containing protein [Propionibacteriaceae bacterium]|nr:zf-HC2 domain-containing protein [Propionibacteriaceae bacterium]